MSSDLAADLGKPINTSADQNCSVGSLSTNGRLLLWFCYENIFFFFSFCNFFLFDFVRVPRNYDRLGRFEPDERVFRISLIFLLLFAGSMSHENYSVSVCFFYVFNDSHILNVLTSFESPTSISILRHLFKLHHTI